MKYLYYTLLLLLLISCGKDEHKKKTIDRKTTDWAFYKVEGDVKSVSEKSTAAEPNGLRREDPSAHDADMEFNDDGQLVKIKKWLDDGKAFDETEYYGRDFIQKHTQFSAGSPVVVTSYQWDNTRNNTAILRNNPDNTPLAKTEMKYEKNRLVEKTDYNSENTITGKKTYGYNDQGKLLAETVYSNGENIIYRTLYEYDENGNKITESGQAPNSNTSAKVRFTYAGDKVATMTSLGGNGETDYSEAYTYDDKGNVITSTIFEGFGKTTTVNSNTYDSKGNKLSWNTTRNGKPHLQATYKYDSHNNLTEGTVAANDAAGKSFNETRTYQYEYDAHGNWTKKKTTVNGKPAFITRRTITYFE